jgi:hypothetical protein
MTSPETDTTMKLTACSDNMTLAICPFGGMSENFKISALGTSTVLEIAFKDCAYWMGALYEMELTRSNESFTYDSEARFAQFPSSARV